MAFQTKSQDADARLDYTWPWAAKGWLTAGDTITDATFTVYAIDADGTTPIEIPETDTNPVVVDEFSFTDEDATAWLMGGTAAAYLITCSIETAEGRKDDRSLKLKIVQK